MSQVIALVDDDRNILTSVSIALQQEGFVTRVYSDPAAALKAVGDNPPDLGVFDIKMPRMDGMELLRRVREFSSMPVIFLTSKDDELDEALGLAMGADDYISKPFSQRLLIARIRALLRRQELARGEATAEDRRARAAAARARPAGDGPGASQSAVGRQGRQPDRDRIPDPRGARAAARASSRPATSCWMSPITTTSMSTTAPSTATSSASAASSAPRTPNSMRSRPSMASDTDLTKNEEADLALSWSGRWTLAHRILAVNMLTLAAGRAEHALPRRVPQPLEQGAAQPDADRDGHPPPPCAQSAEPEAARSLATVSKIHREPAAAVRAGRHALIDSWHADRPDLPAQGPDAQSWTKDVARALDRGFNAIVGARIARRLSSSRRSIGSRPGPRRSRARKTARP